MKHLTKLPEEFKQRIAGLRLDNVSYQKISEHLVDEGHDYTGQTVGNWCRSPEGKRYISSQHQELTEEWGRQPMAEKFSRVNSLIQIMVRLRDHMDSLDVETPEFFKASQEFRAYAALINKEMEPITFDVKGESDAPYEKFMRELRSSFPSDQDLETLGIDIGVTH